SVARCHNGKLNAAACEQRASPPTKRASQRSRTMPAKAMSYGTNLADSFRQVGTYTGSIINGAKPAELPVLQSTKSEFSINLHTAKALGLEVPPQLLASVDEVIE